MVVRETGPSQNEAIANDLMLAIALPAMFPSPKGEGNVLMIRNLSIFDQKEEGGERPTGLIALGVRWGRRPRSFPSLPPA